MTNAVIRDYTEYCESEILSLYESVGWTNYTQKPAMLRAAYANSLAILGAYSGGGLTGVVRAVGDGASIVYVQDLIVRPEYQRRGVGKALLHAMLDRYANAYQTVLLTDNRPETAAFYRACGFGAAADMGCACFIKINRQPGN